MKLLLTGGTCALLLLCGWTAPSNAQEPATAPQNPPAGGERPDDQQGASPFKINQPPPLVKVPVAHQPGERGGWIGASLWFGNPKPKSEKGSAINDYSGTVRLQGSPQFTQSFEAGFGIASHDMIHLTYFTNQASGGETLTNDVQVWTEIYPATNYLATNYRLKSIKLTYDYLTWPYPARESKFRLKTTWGMQYTTIRTGFDAPLIPLTDALGNPKVDSSGNPITYMTSGSTTFWGPSVGMRVQEWVKPYFRLEAGASGFGIPHRWNTWDSDATANLRVGHYELSVGVRAYHFRTSASHEFWFHGTMVGPVIGLRAYTSN